MRGRRIEFRADIQLNDDVDVEGDRDLHIYGTIIEGPSEDIPTDPRHRACKSHGIASLVAYNLLSAGEDVVYSRGNSHGS